jgi:metal-responsive CopG/Arc/MetJ family transcriptional regulator
MSKSSKPIPLAVSNDLLAKIDQASVLTGRSRSELMRLAIEIGLAELRSVGYDIAGTIHQAAKASSGDSGQLKDPKSLRHAADPGK